LLAPLLQQLAVCLPLSLVLDRGRILKHVLIAMLAYWLIVWLAVLVVAIRRRHTQKWVDEWVLPYGFFVILPAVLLVGQLIGSLLPSG